MSFVQLVVAKSIIDTADWLRFRLRNSIFIVADKVNHCSTKNIAKPKMRNRQ